MSCAAVTGSVMPRFTNRVPSMVVQRRLVSNQLAKHLSNAWGWRGKIRVFGRFSVIPRYIIQFRFRTGSIAHSAFPANSAFMTVPTTPAERCKEWMDDA